MSENTEDEFNFSGVKKFKTSIRRLSMLEAPLAPGSIALCFDEDEEGKPFSLLIEDLLNTEDVKETIFKNNVLQLKYWINVTITSEPNEKSLQDLRYGLGVLDEVSRKHRIELTTDEKQQIKEAARRIAANIHVIGLYGIRDYIQEFDTCCLDMSSMEIEDIEKNAIYIVEASQRVQPTAFVIPTELANNLTYKEFAETPLGKTLEAKINLKSVFAPKEHLDNNFVRAIL